MYLTVVIYLRLPCSCHGSLVTDRSSSYVYIGCRSNVASPRALFHFVIDQLIVKNYGRWSTIRDAIAWIRETMKFSILSSYGYTRDVINLWYNEKYGFTLLRTNSEQSASIICRRNRIMNQLSYNSSTARWTEPSESDLSGSRRCYFGKPRNPITSELSWVYAWKRKSYGSLGARKNYSAPRRRCVVAE